ncbi:MAG: lamin tail domain-containing protein [Bythopirellula sp.]
MKMTNNYRLCRVATLFFSAGLMCVCSTALAQLRLTEVMYNSVDSDGTWEWIEVENTSGADIDFSVTNYVLDDAGGNIRTGANLTEGVIPAGTKAILTDRFDFATGDPDGRFAAAWGSGINVIGASNYPGWNNGNSGGTGGDTVGIWDSFANYNGRDFGSAIVALDYIPIAKSGDGAPTIHWNGTGDSNDIANWQDSAVGDAFGGYLSQESFIGPSAGERLNSDDIANPGVVQMTGTPNSTDPLIFTEIMYDPTSNIGGDQAGFEWVEVYNNSGAAIDTTGYVFDDDFSSRKTASNVAAGNIPAGGVAVLYNDSFVTEAQMQVAWGNQNFIAVSEWGNLFNGGETIGLWSSLAQYQMELNNLGDDMDEPTVTEALTETQITYDNGDGTWEEADGVGSIYLENLNLDEQDGFNWLLSESGTDGSVVAGSMIAEEGQNVPDHVGGEIGSPGPGFTGPMVLFGDADNDLAVAGSDLLAVTNNFGNTGADDGLLLGDADDDGAVAGSDLLAVTNNFGNTLPGSGAIDSGSGQVPEPTSLAIAGLAIAIGGVASRRRRM